MGTASFTAAALTAALAVGTVGCTGDASGTSLIILKNQVPDADCGVPAQKGGTFISRGVIDTSAATGGYVFTPLVESRTEALESDDPFQRSVTIEGGEVSLTFADPSLVDQGALEAAGALNFTQRFSVVVEPGDLVGLSLIALPLAVLEDLDASLAEGEQTQVLSSVVIFGELGGGDIESNQFTYPIDVCKGCRLIDAGSCVGYQPSGDLLCFPGQDAYAVECCTSSDGQRVCPAVPESEPQ